MIRHNRTRFARRCWLIWLTLCASAVLASERSYLEVSPADQEDLNALFETLEVSLDKGLPTADPVVVILHGSEAASFTSGGYAANRALIDRAARLAAYRLIDVRMCETWMTENGIQRSDIPAFIDTVPYAPEEIEQLESEGYLPHGRLPAGEINF